MMSPISVQSSGINPVTPAQVPATKNIPEHKLLSDKIISTEQNKAEEIQEKYSEAEKSILKNKTDKLNQVMDLFNYSIQFSIDDESNRTVIKVVNSETDEVIRQIPPKGILQLMRRLDQMVGVIIDEKV